MCPCCVSMLSPLHNSLHLSLFPHPSHLFNSLTQEVCEYFGASTREAVFFPILLLKSTVLNVSVLSAFWSFSLPFTFVPCLKWELLWVSSLLGRSKVRAESIKARTVHSNNVQLSQICRIWVWPVLPCDNCEALREFYVSFKESLCEGIAFDSPEDTGGCVRFWVKVTLCL